MGAKAAATGGRMMVLLAHLFPLVAGSLAASTSGCEDLLRPADSGPQVPPAAVRARHRRIP